MHTPAALHAEQGLVATRRATDRLGEVVAGMNDAIVHAPSRLPGWSRAHVLSHLARNADGLVNLLTWARTGVEHPMYASTADRDADIAEGAPRLFQVHFEDLVASNDRFFRSAEGLPVSAWQARVGWRVGLIEAAMVPWMRLTEVLVHLVDLGVGVRFADVVELAGGQLGPLIDYLTWTRADGPPLWVAVELPSGEVREWSTGSGQPGEPVQRAHGPAEAVLAWLTGRDDPEAGLVASAPELPAWL
ncbi:MAG TPA: maleylpyruvate isomerase N-terminal domain-containing protein [Pseudonocardiaceae bacterium]|jgi:maleylpyruvate isomerase|nr:maleylpyruvate isomerase N-terminal domain-containing protein [Pseudonocardiaceae bacterium]